MKRKLAVLLAIPAAVAAVAIPTVADSADGSGQTVLEFDVMAGVIEPFTGTDHPIRGVPGGGLPWDITRGRGLLRGDGLLKVGVNGLVLARRAPVPRTCRARTRSRSSAARSTASPRTRRTRA